MSGQPGKLFPKIQKERQLPQKLDLESTDTVAPRSNPPEIGFAVSGFLERPCSADAP